MSGGNNLNCSKIGDVNSDRRVDEHCIKTSEPARGVIEGEEFIKLSGELVPAADFNKLCEKRHAYNTSHFLYTGEKPFFLDNKGSFRIGDPVLTCDGKIKNVEAFQITYAYDSSKGRNVASVKAILNGCEMSLLEDLSQCKDGINLLKRGLEILHSFVKAVE